MFIKTTFTRSFSLCILILCTATLVTFSQTSNTPVTQEAETAQKVMPVARTLTSADGRTIDVVIVSKTDTAIKAKRADGKEFEITLDKLSDADKAFVAGLTNGAAALAPGKKASVLYVIDWLNSDDYEKNHKEQVAWLKDNGYDVTIGLGHYFKTTLAQIADEKVIWLTPLAMMDSYDIVWIQKFDKANTGATKFKEYDFYQLANHRSNQGGIAVIHTWEDNKTPILAYTPSHSSSFPSRLSGRNFVKSEGNWIFFWDQEEGSKTTSKEAIRLKLLREMERLQTEMKK